MNIVLLVILITSVISICYASSFEWMLHRFLMHRPFLGFSYPFKTHALVHHHIFRYDHTYHLINEKDKWTIPMAWWNGPVLVVIATLPVLVLGFMLGHPIAMPLSTLAVLGAYYGVYEYIHWCMHLKLAERRVIERLPFVGWMFFRLNGHHLLHHRYMKKNFNVVLPLADLCLGTLILRAKTHFKQATGPSVPDVQPKDAWPGIPDIGNDRVGQD